MGRRLLTDAIVNADEFITMPASAQGLYLQLMFAADDDGFVKNPRTIARMSNASDDDLQVLLSRRYLLEFDHGVVLIKHWRMHNLRRFDRYVHTVYVDEYNSLYIKTNGAYTQNPQEGVSCRGLRVWLPTSIDNGNHIEQSRQPHQPIVATTSANDGNHINDNGNQTFNGGNHINDKILIEKRMNEPILDNTEDNIESNYLITRTRVGREEFLRKQCQSGWYLKHIKENFPDRVGMFEAYIEILLNADTEHKYEALMSLNSDKFSKIFDGLWKLEPGENYTAYVWKAVYNNQKEANSGG
nr:MAG TPA: hypothetical protein [Caudoviricetes sp.]